MHSQHGPTNTAVRKNFQAKILNTNKQHDLDVVIGRDGPGGRQGIIGEKVTDWRGLTKRTIYLQHRGKVATVSDHLLD